MTLSTVPLLPPDDARTYLLAQLKIASQAEHQAAAFRRWVEKQLALMSEDVPTGEITPVALSRRRRALALTQRELAARVGVSLPYYRKIERGQRGAATTFVHIGRVLTRLEGEKEQHG